MKRIDQDRAWQEGICLIDAGDRHVVACEVRKVTGLRLTECYIVARQYQEVAVAVIDGVITNMIEGSKI